jgi:hypothetical protein
VEGYVAEKRRPFLLAFGFPLVLLLESFALSAKVHGWVLTLRTC